MNSLKNVKVGDKLLVRSLWNTSIETVIKVTKLHVLTDHNKFRKSGYAVTSNRCDITSAQPATEDDIMELKRIAKRRKMLNKCHDITFNLLSDTQLEQILEIANKKEV
jgi:hypothetical protein|nr:MAG TPA: hypothetical protein [Caudoviricetes sp.]